jgi:hypothetical protein
MNKYNIDFFYIYLFTMRSQCVLNRSSNQDPIAYPLGGGGGLWWKFEIKTQDRTLSKNNNPGLAFYWKNPGPLCPWFFFKVNNMKYWQPVGVSPLQLVNLHRNRRYFVIKLHTWFCLSYFLKTNLHFYCIYHR